MNGRLKRTVSVLLAALCMLAIPVPASAADGGGRPLYAADIRNGTYEIGVDSTSSMFRVVACTLTVTDEGMKAHMTLSGQGFGKLYLGRGADAGTADESAVYPFGEDAEGRHTFDIPVEALDIPIPCAGWSIKREQWYDRDITFRSDTLPEGTVLKTDKGSGWILWTAAGCVTAAVAAVFAAAGIRKRKKGGRAL